MDFLTIPPMAAECERVFSAAGKMVVVTRNRLDTDIIGICQVLRLWYLAGVITKPDPNLVPLQFSDDVEGRKEAGGGEGGDECDNSGDRGGGGGWRNRHGRVVTMIGTLGRFSLLAREHQAFFAHKAIEAW
jgi:hypothetical protein